MISILISFQDRLFIFARRLLSVGAEEGFAVRAVVIRVLAAVHTVWDTDTGPAAGNKQKKNGKVKDLRLIEASGFFFNLLRLKKTQRLKYSKTITKFILTGIRIATVQ